MTPAPPTHRLVPAALPIAWFISGAVLVVANGVLADLYHTQYRTEMTFMPVSPTPEETARRAFAEAILQTPWVSVAYALVGGYAFRRYGCLTAGWAGFVLLGSLVVWVHL
ncbi:MAG TPA: hypothetical protein VH092_16295 [Urbifossiella sp.]|nr:hypothetical protein [Urbifossiella sp.]